MNRTGIPENFSAFNLEHHIEKERGRVFQERMFTFQGVYPLLLHRRTIHTLGMFEPPIAQVVSRCDLSAWSMVNLVVHLDRDVLGILEHVGHCTAVLLLVQQ